MSKKHVIRLAKGLEVPLSVTTQKIALMGGNGSGKSYTASKLEEEILRAEGWVIILDPVGIHWGLRLAADGVKPSGLDIPVFGGLHGDILLTPESGALIADLLCDRRLSAVLDVSQFTDSELNRFSTDFGNQFWSRMKSKRQAILLVFEECQEFIPQNPMKGEEKKLHIYTRIAKLGRNYGVGVMLISQRPQDVNKKVFNLTQLMFAFQMTGTHERKSMEEWISYIGLESKFSNILPTLEVGQPFVASPRWLKVADTFHIDPKNTYDSSSTPDFEEDTETVRLEPIDIGTLEERMKGLIQEAKANDPAELKREIVRLKKEIEKRPIEVRPEKVIERIEIPVITNEQIAALDHGLESVKGMYGDFQELKAEILTHLNGKIEALNSAALSLSSAIASAKKPAPVTQARPVVKSAAPQRPAPVRAETRTEGQGSITGPMQRILNAIAWMESIGVESPSQVAVAFLAGYTYGGGAYNNPRGSVNTMGLVSYLPSNRITLTDEGRKYAEYPSEALDTQALHDKVFEALPGPETAILKTIINYYPDMVSKEDIAAGTINSRGESYQLGGAFNNPIGRLKTLGLIEYPKPGYARAAALLFLE